MEPIAMQPSLRRRGAAALLAGTLALMACGERGPAKETKPMDAGMVMDSAAPGDTAAHTAMAQGVTFTAEQVRHGRVRWGPVPMGTATVSATVPGQVAPNEDRTARLGAPGRGRVVAVRVAPGDRVRAGQVLVTLQSPEAGAAHADVAKAEAQATGAHAQATYAASAKGRAERLLALKAIPRQEYERALADDEMAQSAARQADAELRRARSTALALGATSEAGGEIVLRAPRAGVVLARTAVPGTVVEAGAPLVVVTDPATLWLTIDAPEGMAGLFHVGARLRFLVPAFPADTFGAQITAVGAGLDRETRTLPVRGIVTGAGGRLRPEMLARVLVDGVQPGTIALLPEEAVQTIDGTPTVFLAMPDGKGGAHLMPRPVLVGPRANGRIAVTRGLTAGEIVVLEGAFAVKAQLAKAAMPDMEM